jgi:hypothetical protein
MYEDREKIKDHVGFYCMTAVVFFTNLLNCMILRFVPIFK